MKLDINAKVINEFMRFSPKDPWARIINAAFHILPRTINPFSFGQCTSYQLPKPGFGKHAVQRKGFLITHPNHHQLYSAGVIPSISLSPPIRPRVEFGSHDTFRVDQVDSDIDDWRPYDAGPVGRSACGSRSHPPLTARNRAEAARINPISLGTAGLSCAKGAGCRGYQRCQSSEAT
jgi:hypothetical protein